MCSLYVENHLNFFLIDSEVSFKYERLQKLYRCQEYCEIKVKVIRRPKGIQEDL